MAMSRHAETVFAAVASKEASLLVSSWRRSAEYHRLEPDRSHPPERDLIALRQGREREARLVDIAAPYLDCLFSTLDEPDAAVFLADRHGLVLDMRTRRQHDVWRRSADHVLGTTYSEAALGTSGLGTCLVEQRPLIVRADEHFMTRHMAITAVGAPVFGADGVLAGGISCSMFSGPAARDKLVLLALADFARRIGIALFAAAHRGQRLMLAAAGADGRHPDALLALDGDGYVHGATRSARRLLDLSEEQMAAPFALEPTHADGSAVDIAAAETRLIAQTMSRLNGNRSAVARALGISRSTLYRKLQG